MNSPLATAIEQNMNVVISYGPGENIHTKTLNDLGTLNDKVLIVDAFREHLDRHYLDEKAEVVVFDEPHLLAGPKLGQVKELMTRRTVNGEETMPNLKSVVVMFTHRNETTDAVARELSRLAPSLELTYSN